jgi:hypothetical protein
VKAQRILSIVVLLKQNIGRIEITNLFKGFVHAAGHSGTVDPEYFHLSKGAREVVDVFFCVGAFFI